MRDLIIDVGQVEEFQTLQNIHELEKLFEKAQSAIVNGSAVVVTRKFPGGRSEKFDEISTLDDLRNYRSQVFKYLK